MNKLKKNNQSISKLAGILIRHYQIPVRMSKEKALDTILQKIDRQDMSDKNKTRYVYPVSRFVKAGISVAAVLAIIIAFYFFTSAVIISSGDQEIYTCRLPDQSRIVLHKGSEIKYNKYLWRRRVNLTGEAYFEVEKGPGFKVNTNEGDVEVLGTRFMVSQNSRELKVRCFQGRVTTLYGENSYILDPGMEFSGSMEVVKTENLNSDATYPAFATFNRTFSNEKLMEVISQIESFYNVKIDLQNTGNKVFTGTIKTGKLESAVQIVCESLQLKYRVTDTHEIKIFNN